MKKFVKFWLPVGVWVLTIFIFSSIPTKPVSEVYWKDFFVKKLAHIVEYGILSTLIYRALINFGMDKKRSAIYSVLSAIFYGITDEFHQSFTPGREPKARDIIFDTIGASSAIYLIWNLLPKAPLKLKRWAENLQLI